MVSTYCCILSFVFLVCVSMCVVNLSPHKRKVLFQEESRITSYLQQILNAVYPNPVKQRNDDTSKQNNKGFVEYCDVSCS